MRNTKYDRFGRFAVAAAASAVLAGGAAFAGTTPQPASVVPVPGNTNGNNYETFSISGSTAMRNFTTSTGFSLLPADTTIFLSSGTFTAPQNTFSQLAPQSPTTLGATDVAATRVEWHEQGSVEGILELSRDQVFGSSLPGDAPLSLTAAGNGPTVSNPVWINRAIVAADNTSNANGWAYGTTGPNGGNNGQSPVQMAISDVKPIQGFSQAGTPSFTATPGSAGYGLGNPLAPAGNDSSGLGVTGARDALVAATDLNVNGRTGGISNLTSNTVAITATTFAANPGTGLTNVSQNDAQFLQLAGRFANGATFQMTTRDVNSGTRSSAANNSGIDPSWAVGVNDGGDALVSTSPAAADNQDVIASNTVTALDGTSIPNATIRFSGKTAGGLVRTTIANSRLAIGTLSLPDALSSSFSRTAGTNPLVNTPINVLNYNGVTPNATTITNGTYAIWQQEQYVTVNSATGGIQGDTPNTSTDFTLGTAGSAQNISAGSIEFGTGSNFRGGFVDGQTINGAGIPAGTTVTNVVYNDGTTPGLTGTFGTINSIQLSNPSLSVPTGTFNVSGGDTANFEANILNAARIAGSNIGFTSVANPGDQLVANGFILPQFMQVAKPYDGAPTTNVTGSVYNINTNPNGYNDTLRNEFITSAVAQSNSAPGTFYTTPTNTKGYYGAATRGGGQQGAYPAANQVLMTNGGIAITSSNYLFGNFANTGTRDYNSFQYGFAALVALYNSGYGVDAFDATGAPGATVGSQAVLNSNVLTDAQLNNSGTALASGALASALGTSSSFSGQRGDSTFVNGSTGTLVAGNPYGITNASYGTTNAPATGVTKGDLIVMGDYNNDGRFDGRDVYDMAVGTALSTNTSTNTLANQNATDTGVLRKNAALDFVQANTADASYNTSTGYSVANNSSGFIRQSARVILSVAGATAPAGGTALYNSGTGTSLTTYFTYDPTGANSFNKTDVNRDGVVDFNDLTLIDSFATLGYDYSNESDSVTAQEPTPVTGVLQAANLVLMKQIDGSSIINSADVAVGNSALTGTGTTNWYGSTLEKTGTNTISWQRSGGAVNVNTGASFQISAGTVQVMSAMDPFTDNNANLPTTTADTSKSLAITVTTGGTLEYTGTSTTGIQEDRLASLNISGGTVMVDPVANHANRTVLVTGSLAMTGHLDLGNNDLIAQNGNLATVTSSIQSGYNAGNWNGSGITSVSAANDSTHLTALAVIQNSVTGLPGGATLYTTFDSVPSTSADVLVKYTYYGDTNLDGTVDGSDYSRIDNGYLNGLTGWFNGDFNYDGVIDGSDYTLIDNAYNTQGASLAASVAGPTAVATAEVAGGTSAVPEPATLGLLGVGVGSLLSSRRRRRA
jgi:hypothetical protein